MKVFTCDSDSVLAQYISFSTPKLKTYAHMDIPDITYKCLADNLKKLVGKVRISLLASSLLHQLW